MNTIAIINVEISILTIASLQLNSPEITERLKAAELRLKEAEVEAESKIRGNI